jgi:CBS-domain-containing membrane protein
MTRSLGREAEDETLIDLSALVHGAYRVSPQPSLSRTEEDVNETAKRLTETYDVQDDLLIKMAQGIVRSLKQSYFRRAHGITGCLLDCAKGLAGGLSTYAGS